MLELLGLDFNQLSGLVPQAMFNMSRLQEISLVNNRNLTGTFPSNQSFSLPMLQFISLYGNKFAGRLPSGFASCQYLQAIDLHKNSFVDVLPTWLAKLTNLKKLNLGFNHLIGSIPAALSNLTKLTKLQLANGSLTGEIPPELGLMQDSHIFILESIG